MVCDAAREGDEIALFLVDRCCRWLACGVFPSNMIVRLVPNGHRRVRRNVLDEWVDRLDKGAA